MTCRWGIKRRDAKAKRAADEATYFVASIRRLYTRRSRLVLTLYVFTFYTASLLISAPNANAQSRHPNIVFILIDDMGQRDVGCYGSRFYETPNIDALAQRGMRFTNAYAACPVCSPTRVSILTGKYPARLNLTDWLPGRPDRPNQKLARPQIIDHLPLEENNLAKALKSAGYVSASIGKWHLGGPKYWPEKQGFDLNVGGTATGSPPGGYFNFKTPSMTAADPDEYLTDRLTSEAEKFIEQNKDRPFFLYLAHYAVHIPLAAKQKMLEHYRQKIRPDDPQNNPIYAAMVQSVDESVGRIVKKIDELKLGDNTLIIFTSDNGGLSVKEGPNTPSTSNAPLRAGKGYLYEGGIREPLIAVWPNVIPAAATCDTSVCSIDFYPTFLKLAGVSPAPGQIIDGVDINPLLRNTGSIHRDALYWHYPHYANQGGKPGTAVREGDWKLIQFYEDDHLELYNLTQDIEEKNDLAKSQPQRAQHLRQMLDEWRKSVDAKMMTPNPNYRPGNASVGIEAAFD
jgi:arylsulfatase A